MIPRSTFTRHLATSAALLLAGAPVFAQTALPLAELGAGMYRIEAEVAHTFETRQVGLMNRAAMPLHRGMVFVFPEARAHCMWMKNTPLPLSVGKNETINATHDGRHWRRYPEPHRLTTREEQA